jgi:hypothetical protein
VRRRRSNQTVAGLHPVLIAPGASSSRGRPGCREPSLGLCNVCRKEERRSSRSAQRQQLARS